MPKMTVADSIEIDSSPDRIWASLTSDDGFRQWCAVFSPDSYFVGDWSVGSTMRFLARSESGLVGGMVSRVVEHVPRSLIRIEHVGVVENGIDRFEGDDFDEWIPTSEEYHLDNRKLSVSMEVPARYHDTFASRWRLALEKINDIAKADL